MKDVVVIKVFDSDNSLDFEIPISSDSSSPLSITKSLSDLTNLTKRTGVQSIKFKVAISKELALAYDNFNSSVHDNSKDIDSDKDAAILINGSEHERGKIKMVNFSNEDDFEKAELIFIGNNFVWTELIKNYTTADLTWVNSEITYTPATVKGSWDNTVDNGDEWVFPLENRGGRKMLSVVHTEDFRIALFFHAFLTRAFLKIGYTFTGSFTETAVFKRLVLGFWGERFKKLHSVIISNHCQFGSYYTDAWGFTQSNVSYFTITNGSLSSGLRLDFQNTLPLNSGNTQFFTWDDSIASNYDTYSLFDPAAGTIHPTTGNIAGTFTATVQGSYTFDLKCKRRWWGVDYTEETPSILGLTELHINLFIRKFNSLGVLLSTHSFDGNTQYTNNLDDGNAIGTPYASVYPNVSGKATFNMNEDDYTELWVAFQQDYYADMRNFRAEFSNITCKCVLNKEILEGQTFNLPDVLDDKHKVLGILNDFSRTHNIFWDTDTILKEVKIETRDSYYSPISEAIDFTGRVDLSKKISTEFNSVSHKKEMIFKYAKDSADKFVSERDKEIGSTLAEYSHELPAKFKLGTTTVSCSSLAATYYLKDTDSIELALSDKAPYTARLWNEFTQESPNEMIINNNPRLLNYVYDLQNWDGTLEGSADIFAFRFYDETSDRNFIPYVLPHQIEIGGNVIAASGYNLYWHSHHGQDGLFQNHWSKTVTEIIHGTNTRCYLTFDSKQWLDFKFSNVIYFDEPLDLKGYWLVEKIENYQPANSRLIKVKLLKRIEYALQVETTTNREVVPVTGSNARTSSGSTTPLQDGRTSSLEMTVEITDGDGNSVSVPLYTENLDGSKTIMKV